jgi:hypothetical protein
LLLAPNLREQVGERLDVAVVERDESLKGFDVSSETFPELFGRGVVKKRGILVEVRDDEGVAEFLGALHGAEAAAEDGLELAQRSQKAA